MSEKPKSGIALILGGGPKAEDSEPEGAASEDQEAETEAMQAFMDADTAEGKAAALKDFIKLCSPGY